MIARLTDFPPRVVALAGVEPGAIRGDVKAGAGAPQVS